MANESHRENGETAPIAGVAHFLEEHPDVRAAIIDPEKRRLSLAILGNVDLGELRKELAEAIQHLDSEWEASSAFSGYGVQLKRIRNEYYLEKPSCPTAAVLWTWRDIPWPEPVEEKEEAEEWQALAVQAGICGAALVAGFVIERVFHLHTPAVGAYVAAMIAGGWDAAQEVFEKIKKRELDIHFLMLAVAAGAALVGAWGEGALLLFLFSFSGALEHYALHRTQSEIGALFRLAPKTARKIDAEGNETEIAVAKVRSGDRLRIKPGDVFPVDAEIYSGETAADEAGLTGESVPVEKRTGDTVYSGSLNLWGTVDVAALRPAKESALEKVIRLIQEVRHLKAPSQRFTDRFGTPYTYGILTATILVFLMWWLIFKIPVFREAEGNPSALYRAMTFLVVASPCALVLSIPSAILAAIAWGARHGILFRGGAAVEKLAEIDTVALDKTGTLTTGDLQVESVESFPAGNERQIAQLAYSIERLANHPIARALVEYGRKENLDALDISEFQSIAGQGVKGREGGLLCALGRREILEKSALATRIANIPLPSSGHTEVWVVRENVLGRILLKDRIRLESKPVLRRLDELGIATVMLTGDRKEVAESVGAEIGVRTVLGGLKPQDKVAAIQELTQGGHKVAMVGDGANDAPSLAAAYVSVAMGGRGSDAALEQSEVVLMQDKIENFLSAYELSTQARRIIKQNLVISLGTIVVMVISALTGAVPLPLGVMAHEGSTVLVCLNSLRLLTAGGGGGLAKSRAPTGRH